MNYLTLVGFRLYRPYDTTPVHARWNFKTIFLEAVPDSGAFFDKLLRRNLDLAS